MKKILLFLCAVMASFAVSAASGDYFISGQFNGWQHAQIKFDQNGTEYSVTLDGTGLQPFSGKFLICGGTVGVPDWNDKIGGVNNMVADKEYTYVVGGGDMTISGVIAYPLTVSFNTATKKIKITGAAAENDYDTVYIVGDFGDSWDETRTDAALSLKAGTNNVWEGDVTFRGTSNYFKMKAGAYIYGTGMDEDIAVAMGTTYTASQAGNAFVANKGTYHIEFVLDKNADTGKLTVTGDVGPIEPTDYTKWYVNVVGNFNDWLDNGVNPSAEGIAVLNSLPIGTSEFKVKIWDGVADVWFSTGSEIPVGEWVTINGNSDANMTIAGATAESAYNVEFNCETNAIRVTEGIVIDPADMEFFLVGSFNDWTTGDAAYKFTYVEDNQYTLSIAALDGEFKISKATWEEGSWGAEGDPDATEALPVDVILDEEMNAWAGSGCNFKIVEPLTNVTVTFFYNANDACMIMVQGEAGIESVAADAQAAEAVYYNLQGIRVAQPAKGGLYIVNRAGQVSKEIAR